MELKSQQENPTSYGKKAPLSISPPSAAESLFLGPATPDAFEVNDGSFMRKFLNTDNAGQQLPPEHTHFFGKKTIKKSGSFHSALTRASNVSNDDFVSCVENSSDIDSIDSTENNYVSPTAVRSSRFSMETIEDTISSNDNDIDMMAKKTKTAIKKEITTPVVTEVKKTPLPDVAPAAVEEPVADASMKVDAAEVVYGKAKEILLWGKSVPVVSFFVGTSEAVAGKALGVVGTDLSQVDGKIESELTKFDAGILNPAIEAIAKVLLGVAGKSEDALKPIIELLLKPFGKLIKSEAAEETPEAHTENPEITK